MKYRLLSLSSPAPQGFALDAAPDVSKLRRGTFCLYSANAARADALIGPWREKVSGLIVVPGEDWQWRALGTCCFRWEVPQAATPFLAHMVAPYLDIIEQTHAYDDKVKAQEWDLQRAAQDRVFLSQIQVEFRDTVLTAERNLRSAHRFLNQIIDFLPDATLVIDRDKKVIAWNRAMERITGVSKEEIVGKGDYAYAVPFYGEQRPILVDLLYMPDRRLEREYKYVRRYGNLVFAEVFVPKLYGGKGAHVTGSASLLHDQDGNISGAIETVRDITELHDAMEQLHSAKLAAEAANMAKSQFLSNISHEIRTPLNGIIGFAELIIREDNVQRTHAMARTMLRESDILLSLVNAILDQARIESGTMEISYGPTDLRDVVDTTVQTVGLLAKKKGITLEVEEAADVPRLVQADRLRVCQVLMNLMNNAVKFTEKGGVTLRVTVHPPPAPDENRVWLRFEVVDTGAGIPDEKKHLIFQRFAQVDAAATRKHGGAGLGLSLARALVELMGGSIGFDSREGSGSAFWFALPFATSATDTATSDDGDGPEQPGVEHGHPCGPILLVEDYPPSQEVARAHLEGAGYQVDVADDGLAALRRCDAQEYALILMDIQMPEMDGLEATRQLRRRPGWTQHAIILGLSANADEESRKGCLAAGMNGLVTKPLRREKFLQEIARRLCRCRPTGELEAVPAKQERDADAGDTDAPMSFEEAIREFAGNKPLLTSVISQLLLMARRQVSEMAGYISTGDTEAVRREAHKLKGASANITAMRLAAAARAVEDNARSGDVAALTGSFCELRRELDALDAFARGFVAGE